MSSKSISEPLLVEVNGQMVYSPTVGWRLRQALDC